MNARMAIVLAATLVSSAASAQTPVPSIAFGTRHAIALRTNGDVLTWGGDGACDMGRRSSRVGEPPGVIMRNAKEIAAAVRHSLVLTSDGKVYGWGINAENPLGLGETFDKCEGPVLVQSLADKVVTHIATGYGFTVAVTVNGDLYCSGDNSMGQCPVTRASRVDVFTRVPFPELAGNVSAVSAGMFHTLVLTNDRKLYAFGRSRDGQLGSGKPVNGLVAISELTDVVSMAAGTWHSVAARADGSVWAWGNNSKSQMCDGTTMNHPSPTRVVLPDSVRVTSVTAGGHSTGMRASDGSLYVCGDNTTGLLGLDAPGVVAQPMRIPVAATPSSVFTIGGAHAAIVTDCAVRLAGDNGATVVSVSNTVSVRAFTVRPNFSLCGTRPGTPLPTIVDPAPSGGESGCWMAQPPPSAAVRTQFAPLLQAIDSVEGLLKKNAAFMAAPVPVRYRPTMGAGPSGAELIVKVVPERKYDGFRVWGTNPCEVIPQIDRIGGPIFQVSLFFNTDPRNSLIGPSGDGPKLTGRVAGFPEYDNWVILTKDGRLPWIPQTLADRLDVEGARRKQTLDEWNRGRAKTDVGTASLAKQVKDYEQYRASFTPDQLRMAAVWGDPTGDGKRKLDAQIAALQRLTPDEQKQADAWGQESRALVRQAQVEAANNTNAGDAARLRTQANDLANKVRALRDAHMDAAGPLIADALAQYQLTNIRPGNAAAAMKVKPDPGFPDPKDPNRIQLIIINFSVDPDARQAARRAWQQQVKDTFDFAALAALLK